MDSTAFTLMGILNITPDSFSDGGAYASADEAVAAGLRMRDDGAAIIDVGGESTRPGAQPVPAAEQLRRVLPVIEGIRAKCSRHELRISIDSTHGEVARAALDAGADIINDQSAGLDDPEMLALAALRHAPIILMHRRRLPHNDVYSDRHEQAPEYGGDVVARVREFLGERAEAAIASGVRRDAILIDPGLGFGKSVEQNYEIIARTNELALLGYPVVSGASRKSFIGAATGVKTPRERMSGSIAVSVMHYAAGARIFRVHDVEAHRQALEVAQAVLRQQQSKYVSTDSTDV